MSRTSAEVDATASRLLRPEEAADRLGLKPATLAAWRRAGTGPSFVKIGSAIRYAAPDLEQFVQANRRAPGEAA